MATDTPQAKLNRLFDSNDEDKQTAQLEFISNTTPEERQTLLATNQDKLLALVTEAIKFDVNRLTNRIKAKIDKQAAKIQQLQQSMQQEARRAKALQEVDSYRQERLKELVQFARDTADES